MTRWVGTTALGCLAALTLVGCGSGEGQSGAQKEHAARADAICEETQERVGMLGDNAEQDRDLVRTAAERFDALDAPGEGETTWLRFVREADNLWLSLEDLAQSRDPSTNDQRRAAEALTRVNDTNGRMQTLARDYGMQICADGGLAAPGPRARARS